VNCSIPRIPLIPKGLRLTREGFVTFLNSNHKTPQIHFLKSHRVLDPPDEHAIFKRKSIKYFRVKMTRGKDGVKETFLLVMKLKLFRRIISSVGPKRATVSKEHQDLVVSDFWTLFVFGHYQKLYNSHKNPLECRACVCVGLH